MRIIAGKAGGLKLKSLKGREVRPTLDRVKEAMFNIISFYLPETKVLDLFSGFGSLGIEALSRGALEADFVEIKRKNLAVIKENLAKANLSSQANLYQSDVFSYLNNSKEKYDLIFMDPPYENDLTNKTINLIIENDLLKKETLIISEKDKNEKRKKFQNLKIIKNKNYGNSQLTIYKLNDEEK